MSPAAPHRSPARRGRWVLGGVAVLVLLTCGSLTLAWWQPAATWLHFWLVAQIVPVLYWLLILWFDRRAPEDDDVF